MKCYWNWVSKNVLHFWFWRHLFVIKKNYVSFVLHFSLNLNHSLPNWAMYQPSNSMYEVNFSLQLLESTSSFWIILWLWIHITLLKNSCFIRWLCSSWTSEHFTLIHPSAMFKVVLFLVSVCHYPLNFKFYQSNSILDFLIPQHELWTCQTGLTKC